MIETGLDDVLDEMNEVGHFLDSSYLHDHDHNHDYEHITKPLRFGG